MNTRNPLISLVVLLCGACSSLPAKIETSVDTSQSKAARLAKEVGNIEASGTPASAVTIENGIWIGKRAIIREQPALPSIFYEPAAFDRTVSSLSEFAERITLRSGIPVKISADAMAILQGVSRSTAPGAAPPAGVTQAMAGAPQSPGMGAAGPQNIRIVFAGGDFKGLLDTVCARFGIFWRYAGGAIQFFYTDTRTFQISAIPGDSSLNASVTSGAAAGDAAASQGGSANNNSQNTAVRSTLSVYTSIEKSIGIMLSPVGHVVASPATGSITVTDTPDVLDRVAQFIDGENKSLSRRVMINVTVLSVTVSDTDSYGIKWDLIYNDLFRKYGIGNSTASLNDAASFSTAILSANSKWSGSSLLIQALSEQGRVRRDTSASVVTLNNQPVPVQVARQTSYIKSSQTTFSSGIGATTTFTPGQVTSGFNMTVLPNVLNDGTVMLQFSTDISALRRLRTIEGSANSIESPEIDTRNFLQRVAMRSNETLVISGFEQTDDNLDRSGVGSARNLLLGGGVSAESNKEIIVILITPVAMADSRS